MFPSRARRFVPAAALAFASIALPLRATARTYPSKSVRIVVPCAPGGGTDILGRLFAQ
jgi:tripartite-type tricarboxylate transporter receptor subunit TctC